MLAERDSGAFGLAADGLRERAKSMADRINSCPRHNSLSREEQNAAHFDRRCPYKERLLTVGKPLKRSIRY
jgi:hypothetical protein